MRMKKILILAVAATALVACAKSFDKSTSEGQAIGFGTWNEVLTKARAATNDNTAFVTGDAFDVYGYKTLPGSPATNSIVFNGDDVTATVSGSTVSWDYTQHRFWDPAASSYTFYAVLPAGNLAAEENEGDYATTGLFKSNTISFDDPTAFSNDLLVANEKTVDDDDFGDEVELTFNHIASCVDLYIKQDANLGENAVVKVTDLSLLNIHNSGKFVVGSYSTGVPVVTWTDAANFDTPATTYLESTDGTQEYVVLSGAEVTVGGKTTYVNNSATGTSGAPKDLFTGYVFMPQTLDASEQQIKISYTITVGTEEPIVFTDKVIDFADFITTDKDNNTGTAIASWAKNTHYIYYITIGANIITFTAKVANWDSTTITGYQYLLN